MSKIDWFHWISHSTLFILIISACADQLLYSLSLFKQCSACSKQNTAVKTAIDACSFLALYIIIVSRTCKKQSSGGVLQKRRLRNFARFTGKHLFWKRGSEIGAFLWILQNFLEHLFLQNTSDGCFWCFRVNLHSTVL